MANRLKLPKPMQFQVNSTGTRNLQFDEPPHTILGTLPFTPRPPRPGNDPNLPWNGGGVMPPDMGSHGRPGQFRNHGQLFPQWIIDWLAARPNNHHAALLSHGIGGSTTPMSGVSRPGSFNL